MRKLQKLLAVLVITIALALGMGLSAGAANPIAYGAATVDATSLNIRSGPGLEHETRATIGNGAIIVILEQTNSEWYYINYNGTKGFVSTEYLKDVLTAENFSATGTVTGDDVFLRTGPSTKDAKIATYSTGKTASVIGINNGWYKLKVDGHVGYMRSDFMEITSGYGVTAASGTATPAASQTGNELVDFALGYIGYNYKYGGKSPSTGFDCSGFVYYVFNNFGVTLTRSSSGQYKNDGTKISKDELAPGDLVFFSNSSSGGGVGHVGIYMGDSEFVHSSSSNVGVVVSRIDSTYYTRNWIGAKRISF